MRRISIIACAILTVVAAPSLTRAAVILQPGLVGGSGDVENVLFNGSGLISTGNTVQGVTNTSGVVLAFTGTEILTTPATGQARVLDAAGDGYSSLTVQINPLPAQEVDGFSKVQFNLNAVRDGQARITLDVFGGGSFEFTVGLSRNGNNFFTALASGGDLIEALRIDTAAPSLSATLLQDSRQWRLGGFASASSPNPPQPAPEPSILWILGAGLILLGLMSRKRI